MPSRRRPLLAQIAAGHYWGDAGAYHPPGRGKRNERRECNAAAGSAGKCGVVSITTDDDLLVGHGGPEENFLRRDAKGIGHLHCQDLKSHLW